MKKIIVITLICAVLFTNKASAGGWETAGKIMTGAIIGYIATEVLRTPPPACSRPQYYEYRVYVPGYWPEVWIRREGSMYRDKVWVPPQRGWCRKGPGCRADGR